MSRLATHAGENAAESSGEMVHSMSTHVAERGSCGVWDVHFDGAAAAETVRKLANNWHRQENKGHAGRQFAPHSSSKQEDASMGIPASSAANSVCTHAACSAKVNAPYLLPNHQVIECADVRLAVMTVTTVNAGFLHRESAGADTSQLQERERPVQDKGSAP